MARKKEVKSIVPDDLFDDIRLLPKVEHTFGTYKIKGDIVLCGSVQYPKVNLSLYWNFAENRFFIVKQYQSQKYYIDYLKETIYSFFDIMRDFDSPVYIEVARVSKDNSDDGKLFYDSEEKTYHYLNAQGYNQTLKGI